MPSKKKAPANKTPRQASAARKHATKRAPATTKRTTKAPDPPAKQAPPADPPAPRAREKPPGTSTDLPTHRPTDPPASSPRFDRKSAFLDLGFEATVALLLDEIRSLYSADATPWIIGYSGGKDSTAVLQLVWSAIATLPPEQRTKPVHVISTDTMVENPVVSAWVARSIEAMKQAARTHQLPIQPRLLQPRIEDSFWVNLIGRGYPAPRHKFRWCTERLKIRPSNEFIKSVVDASGEAIVALGTRKAESARRAAGMKRHAKGRVRDRLSPNASLPGTLIYTPIEDWTNDDVWFFLMQKTNPWGHDNRALLGMYAGASADGECPLVVDTSTPSCGDSRFGCWVCTLVEQDKSMTAMIQNDAEKEWMLPLLDLRNALDFRNSGPAGDRRLRDFRRMSGAVQLLADDRVVPGPYTQPSREQWLRKLLAAQTHIRRHGPPEMRDLELITLEELREIRRIWLIDKHEIEDSLPRVYRETTGDDFPDARRDDDLLFGAAEVEVLHEVCGDNRLHFELTRELLSITYQQRHVGRRAGLFEQLERTISKHFYDDEADAIRHAKAASAARPRHAHPA